LFRPGLRLAAICAEDIGIRHLVTALSAKRHRYKRVRYSTVVCSATDSLRAGSESPVARMIDSQP
jgi:hypothetical protein